VLQSVTALAAVSASPTSVNWVSVPVGNKGGQKVVTLTNGGTTAITISGITFSGANPGDFQIFTKTCGTSLGASASCTVNIVFAPTTTGSRTATLNFNDTGSGSPQTVTLSGTGTSGASATPSALSFGAVNVGSSSAALSTSLKNESGASISLSSISVTGTNSADFTISSKTCGTSLAVSASCSVSVVFKPLAAGTRVASLTFTDTASNSPQAVALSGTGTTGASYSPTTLSFGTVSVGSSSAAQSTTLKNVTSASISISSISIAGTNSADFAISSKTCGATLAASASCSVSVIFKPTAAGTRAATLTFTDTANNSPQVVSLAGSGAGGTSGALAVYPTTAAVVAGSEQVFQAQLSGVPDGHSLSYSIDGVSGGNSTTGTVTNQGLYTAPSVAGTHQLSVTDNSLGTTATSAITVYSTVSVDFDSRSTSLYAVPAGVFGAQRLESLHNAADLDLVKAGGITYARMYAQIPSVFKTSTPNWSAIDGTIRTVTSSGGVHVILQMYQTPPWLQPSSDACGTGDVYALPTNLNSWGSIAAQYVKHMDATFPGIVTDYEIWNEPNTASLCVPAANRMSDYMSLYSAAVPQMKAQAKTDGVAIRVGGPASAGLDPSWITAMLNDPTISQNIDFTSYHQYLFGSTQLGAQWGAYNNVESVYQRTQDDLSGPAATYEYAATLVGGGKQPQGKNLPIYLTEYNLNWAFAKDCCRNDYTYGPLWNGVYVADLLNVVYAYAGAPNPVGHLVYYAATAPPYFCLVGEYDANMDCTYPAGSVPKPYPQYFLYQLLGAPAYLGLQNGGYMAKSISPATLGNGLVVTAFYTVNLDAIVLINPSQYTYTDMPVTMANTGLASPVGTLYQIVSGQSIQTSSVSLQSQGGTSYSTKVTIGPYSVQAISLHH
jgi:hypothetical protein